MKNKQTTIAIQQESSFLGFVSNSIRIIVAQDREKDVKKKLKER